MGQAVPEVIIAEIDKTPEEPEVEDSKDVLKAITMGLKTFGYKVIEANGSEKAIQVIHESTEKIDLLFKKLVYP